MAVDIEHLRGQMARLKSVAGEPRYADEVKKGLLDVVSGLCVAVADLKREVDELKRHAKG